MALHLQDGVTDVHLAVLRNDLADSIDGQAIIDFEMAVELENKAVLETLPAAFPLDPTLQALRAPRPPVRLWRRRRAPFPHC